jgi:arylsulfatase A-like enzyme
MAAALFGYIPGCRKKVSDDNFIFITLDTQRADFISAYNNSIASTPNIDSLAKKGVLFENCYSLTPITLPSHASMFFSKPPHEVKNYNNGQIIRHKRKRPSFVSFFKKNGFRTAAFISLGVLTKKFGLNEGFDLYNDDDFPEKRWYLTAEEVNNKVLPWLEENRDKKFFLWVHYSDPHDPYSPPGTPNDFKIFLNEKLILNACLRKYEYHELKFDLKSGKNRLRLEIENQFVENEDYFRGKLDRMKFFPEPNSENLDIELSRGWLIKRDRDAFFFKNNSIIDVTNHKGPMEMSFSFRGSPILTPEAVRSLYKDEVEYMDQEIGNLLEKLNNLGISHKTKIMIIGDHGEGLGEYKNFMGDPHFGHIHYLKDVYMKIPLIIYDPHKPKKALRVKEIATTMDVAPTIFGMMRLKSFQGFRGKDLLHPKKHDETAIFMETHKPEATMNRFAILQFPWHMIFTPENRAYQLFNLETDPEEKHDLFGNKDLPDETKTLKQRLDEFARDVLKNKEEIKIDKKTEEMLRSLGYIK